MSIPNSSAPKTPMPFGRKNYTIMLAGIGVILLGFFLMSIDSEPFGFGFLGLTLGPLTIMTGFGIQFWAIFAKDKEVDIAPISEIEEPKKSKGKK